MPVPGKMCFRPESQTKGEAAGLYHKTASAEAENCCITPSGVFPKPAHKKALSFLRANKLNHRSLTVQLLLDIDHAFS
jgi:hypothetical protein